MKNLSWKEPFNQSLTLKRYVIDEGGCDPRKVEEYWHRTFCCVAKYLGFGRKERGILWDQLVRGNWERLHTTEEEDGKAPDHWLEKLAWDCFYCSDRWSLDRLTRCHWLYRAYMSATKREAVSNV